MNSEQNTNDPSGYSDEHPLTQAPLPMPPQQSVVGQNANAATNYESEETKELAREFRVAEKWAIGINGVLAIVAVVAVVVYNGQLKEMRRATRATEVAAKAAKDSADVAKHTFEEMQKGGADTHALAV